MQKHCLFLFCVKDKLLKLCDVVFIDFVSFLVCELHLQFTDLMTPISLLAEP